MASLLQIDHPPSWNHCPVLLPYSPHTISVIVPGYLGILIPFLFFSAFLFMYLHKLWMENFEGDVKKQASSVQYSSMYSSAADSPYSSSRSSSYT